MGLARYSLHGYVKIVAFIRKPTAFIWFQCILAAIIMEKMRGLLLQVRDLKKLWQTSLTDSVSVIVVLIYNIMRCKWAHSKNAYSCIFAENKGSMNIWNKMEIIWLQTCYRTSGSNIWNHFIWMERGDMGDKVCTPHTKWR